MINRFLFPQLTDAVAHNPAVALLGPRQVGKTTLALAVERSRYRGETSLSKLIG